MKTRYGNDVIIISTLSDREIQKIEKIAHRSINYDLYDLYDLNDFEYFEYVNSYAEPQNDILLKLENINKINSYY